MGVLSYFDRVVRQGTLPSVAYRQAMTTELDRREIRVDYAEQFALATSVADALILRSEA